MLGERLREERKRLGWSQPTLGEIAGAAKRTVIDWEKGVSSPTTAQLAALGRQGVDVLFVLIGRRSIDRAGMTEGEVELFNLLVNLFWSASDESRNVIVNMLSALHARDVQQGNARGVRKPKGLDAAADPNASHATHLNKPKPAQRTQQVFHAEVGQVAGHNIVNKGSRKR